MKKLLMLVGLAFAISTLMFTASASDFSDDSQFLIIYQPYDNSQSGKWIPISNDSVGRYNTMTAGGNEETLLVYVNEEKAEYNSIDVSGFTTEELVVFILNNRQSMASMLYFSISTDPYEEAKAYYHGLAELEMREDAESVLLRAYNALTNATPGTDSESAIYRMRIQFINIVLSSGML